MPPSQRPFLTAEWRKLAIANFIVDPAVLLPYVPLKTQLDTWNGHCYVSLVGFMFFNTRVKGFKIPFHVNFEEINLRFYIRCGDKRGVCFIREIVSKSTVSIFANAMYGEHYTTMPTAYSHIVTPGTLNIEYRWKTSHWNSFRVATEKTPVDLKSGSEEEFILEHYWGYTKGDKKTVEYAVEHPHWQVYPLRSYSLEVDFEEVYGNSFGFLSKQKPVSVLLAEGSDVVVQPGRKI